MSKKMAKKSIFSKSRPHPVYFSGLNGKFLEENQFRKEKVHKREFL